MPIKIIPECRYCGTAVEPTEPMGAWIHTGLSIWCPGDPYRTQTATPIVRVEPLSKLGQPEQNSPEYWAQLQDRAPHNNEPERGIYWDETLEGPFGIHSARIIDEDEGGVIAYCHTDSANRIVEALRAQREAEVSKLGQSEGGVIEVEGTLTLDDLAKLNGDRHRINEQGYPIYPAGTPIEEVSIRDRSQKMIFKCDEHPDVEWASKDPFVSRWFGNPAQGSICPCEWSNFKLSHDYSPTRND